LRYLALAGVFACLLVLVPTASAVSVPDVLPVASAASPPDGEQAMFTQINATRGAHGRPAVKYSEALSDSARAYAGRMARYHLWRHSTRRATRGYRSVREILARYTGRPGHIGTVVRMWLGSGVHRAALLGGSRWAGVGMATGRLSGRVVTYWVVRFADKR
jgi:uncharacterized protein YkwD